jgi:hypothetical protein
MATIIKSVNIHLNPSSQTPKHINKSRIYIRPKFSDDAIVDEVLGGSQLPSQVVFRSSILKGKESGVA